MTARRRRPAYPRVVFDDGCQRVVFKSATDIVIERTNSDAMGERVWVKADFDTMNAPQWFTKKLLMRLLTISRRKSRRSRRRTP